MNHTLGNPGGVYLLANGAAELAIGGYLKATEKDA
tara:strand:+ start:475 stop:579 length:105 start_codon:yes stop_codon:yes gene_type:complete